MGLLDDRVAVVTGAGGGIGREIALCLASEGARVVVNDLGTTLDGAGTAQGPAAETCRLIEDAGGKAVPNGESVADFDGAGRIIAQAVDTFGSIDILVNNAGIGHKPQTLDTLPEDVFDRILAVNAKSVFLTAHEIVPRMKTRKSGAVLNIASTGGVSPRPNLTWYNASKGWMITATRAMAVELAPFGIRVNAINPVAGETPLLATFMGEDTPEIRAKFLASIPIGRFSTPEDIAATACFLCSDEASMITGVALEVDGGRCI